MNRLPPPGSLKRFLCRDCRFNTFDDEYYMVKDTVWKAAKMRSNNGMLCIGCLETRLGRRLMAADFIGAPINFIFPSSKRLQEAKERQP